VRLFKYLLLPSVLFLLIVISSCDKAGNSPRGCVTAFIISLEQHDMSKAWGLLGKDAQSYYNQLGEKQRRSGKGAFENEINRIKTFRSASNDYSIRTDKDTQEGMKLVVYGGKEFKIQISNENGEFKIKDESSIKNILVVITGELKPKDNTY
jgi:hypothetical protein